MLQQTRVDQVVDYYHRFLERFPTLEDLADASVDDVLRVWEGLGYYGRARNLLKGAKQAYRRYGDVPDDHSALLDLPGVGPYTAAAVASIAFGLPFAVLDGNVIRVLARLFAIEDDTRSSATRNLLFSLAEAILPEDAPGDHNQAIMELGATVCIPRDPNCRVCPLRTCCLAHSTGKTKILPFRSRKPAIPHVNVVVGLLSDSRQRYLVTRRPYDAMLGGLWEFPGGKQESGESLEETLVREIDEELGISVRVGDHVFKTKHTYTHFRITLHAFRCNILKGAPIARNGMPVKWISTEEMSDFAFPRANRKLIAHLHKLTMLSGSMSQG
jgi:A/G-specific adenine glycosylase